MTYIAPTSYSFGLLAPRVILIVYFIRPQQCYCFPSACKTTHPTPSCQRVVSEQQHHNSSSFILHPSSSIPSSSSYISILFSVRSFYFLDFSLPFTLSPPFVIMAPLISNYDACVMRILNSLFDRRTDQQLPSA